MPKRVPQPDAFERRHFVESGASARFECEIWVGADADVQNVVSFAKVIGDFESKRGRQLIVRIQRRGVAVNAALLLEDDLPLACVLVEFVRIRRRLQRIDVKSQRLELLIAISSSFFGTKRRCTWLEIAKVCESIEPLVEDRVTHKIADRAISDETCCIKILAILNADERGDVNRV
jgi:hypothetical protein